MALRIIRNYSDEILRKRAREVKEITPSVITLLDDMNETLENAEGLGLAAPQVGVLKRIAIINIGEELIELINPEIIEKGGKKRDYEGCLSCPGIRGSVERPEYVKVKARNRKWEEFEIEGEGLLAVAFCHEIDHLNGILFMDVPSFIEEPDGG